jgi:hypothetical protein
MSKRSVATALLDYQDRQLSANFTSNERKRWKAFLEQEQSTLPLPSILKIASRNQLKLQDEIGKEEVKSYVNHALPWETTPTYLKNWEQFGPLPPLHTYKCTCNLGELKDDELAEMIAYLRNKAIHAFRENRRAKAAERRAAFYSWAVNNNKQITHSSLTPENHLSVLGF